MDKCSIRLDITEMRIRKLADIYNKLPKMHKEELKYRKYKRKGKEGYEKVKYRECQIQRKCYRQLQRPIT